MGSVLSVKSGKSNRTSYPQKSKGDRLGWQPIGTSNRRSLSEMNVMGGRVAGNYCVTSCKKLIP